MTCVFKGKRNLLAQCLYWSGSTFLFDRLPARNTLLVLVYHRIGNPAEDPFDPGVFSATGEQLDDQLKYLKRSVSIIGLEEARAFVHGNLDGNTPRCRVLVTFDDGYLDNHEVAFPILRSHGVQGVFFLSTGLVGTSVVPWWDEIAFLLKTARIRRFCLHYPADMVVDLDEDGIQKSIRSTTDLFKKAANKDPERFIRELKEQTKGEDLPHVMQRFLGWNEAKAMIAGGMVIGSHAHSHHVLSQLNPKQQEQELTESRKILLEKLGIQAESFAFPVGRTTSFTEQTKQLVQKAGYNIAFSYYGGTNRLGQSDPYDVKRVAVFADRSNLRFRVRAATCRISGKFWP